MTGVKTQEHSFEVLSNEEVASNIWRLSFKSEVARCLAPGQFMEFAVPGDGAHVLRIPLSFSWASPQSLRVEILYDVVGEGTGRLSQMKTGEESTLLGPCGRGWWLPEKPGRSLLVAGGIGFPPIMAAGLMLQEAGREFDLVVGAQTAERLLMKDVQGMSQGLPGEQRVLRIPTDDGSEGIKGFVTDAMAPLLAERSYAQVYTCGPSVMMAGIARLADEAGIACQASLERMMGCGFGACSCCNVALVSGGYALCCQDGPVFDAKEVAW